MISNVQYPLPTREQKWSEAITLVIPKEWEGGGGGAGVSNDWCIFM